MGVLKWEKTHRIFSYNGYKFSFKVKLKILDLKPIVTLITVRKVKFKMENIA